MNRTATGEGPALAPLVEGSLFEGAVTGPEETPGPASAGRAKRSYPADSPIVRMTGLRNRNNLPA